MTKKTMFLIPECPCDTCTGEENGLSRCVRDAVGFVHTVKTRRRDGGLIARCGLFAPGELALKKKTGAAMCVNCARGSVVWHRSESATMRHGELIDGLASLHDLIHNLYSFVSAHMHADSEDGAASCEVCKAAKEGLDEHRKGCPDCHE